MNGIFKVFFSIKKYLTLFAVRQKDKIALGSKTGHTVYLFSTNLSKNFLECNSLQAG